MSKYKKQSHVVWKCDRTGGPVPHCLDAQISVPGVDRAGQRLGRTCKLFKSYPQLKKKPYWGNTAPATRFWARGYFVNTAGINEDHIHRYVKYQENEDRKEESSSQGFDLFDPPA